MKLLLLSILLLPTLVFAQSTKTNFQYISFNDGLSNSYIIDILQDNDGYIWIGTDDGLNKYNGYEMVVYRNDPADTSSISNNSIGTLLRDNQGRIWVGTKEGLNLYDAEKNQFTRIPYTENEQVSKIYQTKDSTIWVGTSRGLKKYSEEKQYLQKVFFTAEGATINIFNDEKYSINDIIEYSPQFMVVATWNGLFVIDRKQNTLKLIERSEEGIKVDHIKSIEIDGNRNIWVGTFGYGTFHYDVSRNILRKITIAPNFEMDKRILDLYNDGKGHMWIGTEQSGLYKLYINSFDSNGYEFDHFKDSETPGSLSYRSVTRIFSDANAGLWVGTHNDGINYLSYEKAFFKTIQKNHFSKNTLKHKKVWGLTEDDEGNIWIGTDGGGLNVYNPKTNTFTYYSDNGSLSDDAILCAYKDNEGDLWFGTYTGGLNRYMPQTNTFKWYKHDENDPNSIGGNDVRTILQDKSGKIWIGTNQGGLNVLDKETGKFTQYNYDNSNLKGNDIRSLFIDSKNRLWIGTFEDGLFLFVNGDFKQFNIENDIRKENSIFSIDEDSDGNLWLGTYRTGLVKFDPTKETIEIFDEKKGLSNNIVHSVKIAERNTIWLSSNKGISKFDIDTEEFINYNTNDGLPSLAFSDGSVLASKNGNLYFGCVEGLVFFNPHEKFKQEITTKVIIEEVSVFNKALKPEDNTAYTKADIDSSMANIDHITLQNNQSVFSLSFAAIYLPNPSKVHYSYKLEGIENHWNYLGNDRKVTYAKLPSGEYFFKVKASLDSKNWSDETVLKITVLPPFWKTWWAYLIYTLIIGSIIYLSQQYRLNKFRMERKIELEQVEKKKLSEIYNLKMNFFTNISHEFRTPLTLIISPLEQVIRNQDISGSIKNKLLSIYNHAYRLHNLINQVIEFRKVETGNVNLKVTENDLVKFTYEIHHAFFELAKLQNITFEFHSEVESLKLWFNQMHFETILYNLISNAFKYTSPEGKISIEIKKTSLDNPDCCEIHITDNGKGISAEYLDQIFNRYYQIVEAETIHIKGSGIGLALVKDLVELHKGQINVKSIKDKGTEFILKFKLGASHFSEDQLIKTNADSEHPQHYNLSPKVEYELAEFHEEHDANKAHKHTLLIIEDNHDIRTYIKSLFIQSFKVLEAADGEEGFHVAKAKLPTIIISDIMMPGMDGIELCKKLKTERSTLHIPVVLLTARADDLHKLEGITIGADDYITKPFNPELLQAKIGTLVRNISKLHDYYTSRILLAPIDENIDSADKEFLDKAIQIVESNLLTSDFGIDQLKDELCVSKATLYRKIKQLTGESSSEFIRSIRVKKAAELIKLNKMSISQVAYEVGFSSTRYFRDSFHKIYNMNPSEYAQEFKAQEKL
ncbi:two-component regulator propeller domain-containing protein [Chondrinema litorale]|uniref:two-component regulator propeller domain-containing protein n=1 Tax=Chondrinema litorale TaxID=2994555 RepID=UPI0025431261|nr:two-component regulator propeller domain-containing protein [Chondrinema litorale]UZR97590.1 response regulator [Chondrinema litorale]